MASITSNFRMVKVASSIFPPFANSCAFLNHSSLNGKCPNPGLKLEYLRIIQEKGLLNFDLIQQTVVRGAGGFFSYSRSHAQHVCLVNTIFGNAAEF